MAELTMHKRYDIAYLPYTKQKARTWLYNPHRLCGRDFTQDYIIAFVLAFMIFLINTQITALSLFINTRTLALSMIFLNINYFIFVFCLAILYTEDGVCVFGGGVIICA